MLGSLAFGKGINQFPTSSLLFPPSPTSTSSSTPPEHRDAVMERLEVFSSSRCHCHHHHSSTVMAISSCSRLNGYGKTIKSSSTNHGSNGCRDWAKFYLLPTHSTHSFRRHYTSQLAKMRCPKFVAVNFQDSLPIQSVLSLTVMKALNTIHLVSLITAVSISYYSRSIQYELPISIFDEI